MVNRYMPGTSLTKQTERIPTLDKWLTPAGRAPRVLWLIRKKKTARTVSSASGLNCSLTGSG